MLLKVIPYKCFWWITSLPSCDVLGVCLIGNELICFGTAWNFKLKHASGFKVIPLFQQDPFLRYIVRQRESITTPFWGIVHYFWLYPQRYIIWTPASIICHLDMICYISTSTNCCGCLWLLKYVMSTVYCIVDGVLININIKLHLRVSYSLTLPLHVKSQYKAVCTITFLRAILESSTQYIYFNRYMSSIFWRSSSLIEGKGLSIAQNIYKNSPYLKLKVGVIPHLY